MRPISTLPFAALLACSSSAAPPRNEDGIVIDCRGVPCDWETAEGLAQNQPGWHEGDIALDLSGNGHAVVEQKAVLAPLSVRQLDLDATVVRDGGVALRFELEWYATGTAPGKTFWERSPFFLGKRTYVVQEEGTTRIHRAVLVPSESAGLLLRVVKDGNGRAMVDELTLAVPQAR